MKVIKLSRTGAEVVFHDDIKELPMYKLNAFQIALMQDAGMGSNILDVDVRCAKLDAFLAAEKVKEARHERANMRFGINFMLNSINTKSICLAHLVATIDDRAVKDTTEDDVLAVAQVLEKGGLTYAQVVDLINELKKKLMTESNSTFQS